MPRMLRVLLVVLVALIGLFVIACHRAQVLRRDESPNVTVREVDHDHLDIAGGILHSGLEIANITTDREGSRIFVRVYLRPAGPGARSDFRLKVRIAADTKEVWLGDPPNRRTILTMFGRSIQVPTEAAATQPLWTRRD